MGTKTSAIIEERKGKPRLSSDEESNEGEVSDDEDETAGKRIPMAARKLRGALASKFISMYMKKQS